jgi:DNA-binding response OmpR family regulator
VTAPPRPWALVVEDEAVVRRLATDGLRRAGFDVDESSDGVDALARIGDPRRDYEVLVVDLGLLGVRGEEVIMLARRKRPGVPIIVCTGEFLESPPAGTSLLAKPFTPKELVALAKKLVAERAR